MTKSPIALEAFSEEEYIIRTHEDGQCIRWVSQHLRTEELCRVAVSNSGIALQYVPTHLKTKELCSIAFQQDVGAFPYLPHDLKTIAMCQLAVETNGYFLSSVPARLKKNNHQLFVAAMKASLNTPGPSTFWILQQVPRTNNQATSFMWREIVKLTPDAVAYIRKVGMCHVINKEIISLHKMLWEM